MKKILFFLCAIVALGLSATALTSCDPENGQSFSIVYDVDINGDADGNVTVTFPNGCLNLDGAAKLGFIYSNDTTGVFQGNVICMSEDEILASGDAQKIEALRVVNDWVDCNINAASAGGTYDLHITGYVKETLTGVVIAIDKRLTNRK